MTVTLKSNLELHVDVLRTLACHEPLHFSNFEVKDEMDVFTLKKVLEFLVQNSLVEKRPANRKLVLYAITEQDQKTLKLFSKFTDVLELEDQGPPKMKE